MHQGHGEHLPEPRRDVQDDALMTPADIAEVMRLDEALARIEAGEAVDLDPREDPALVALLGTAAGVRDAFQDVTETRAFRSFHHRSRAALLHALEHEPEEAPAPATIITWRRGRLFTGLAAAAASVAIAAFSFGPSLLDTGAGSQPNLTAARSQAELFRLAQTLNDIQQRTRAGESVPAPLLHSVVENAATMASAIEADPARFDRTAVAAFAQAAQASENVLSAVTPADGAEGALTAAQRAARDGVVVATRFLDGSEAEATATPTAEAAAEPTPEATPDATATEAPAEDDDAEPTATATPAP
ncbi:MAG: hypothetical protein AMXMBFR23_27810 [Chloroflexota bacterium]